MSTRVERAVEFGDAGDEAGSWLVLDADPALLGSVFRRRLIDDAIAVDEAAMTEAAIQVMENQSIVGETRALLIDEFLDSREGQSWLDDYERPEGDAA